MLKMRYISIKKILNITVCNKYFLLLKLHHIYLSEILISLENTLLYSSIVSYKNYGIFSIILFASSS